MIGILKFIHWFYIRSINLVVRGWKNWIYFVIPNFKRINNHRIVLDKYPNFDQLTLCEGEGIVEIGNGCMFGYKFGGFNKYATIELQARYTNSRVKIGNNVLTNNNIFLCAANYIEIGNDTLIGQNVVIMDHEAHGTQPNERRKLGEIGKVVVGKNCWIGNNVTVLKNSEIGENTIVATGAVVSGVFPENVIIGGVPARIIQNFTT